MVYLDSVYKDGKRLDAMSVRIKSDTYDTNEKAVYYYEDGISKYCDACKCAYHVVTNEGESVVGFYELTDKYSWDGEGFAGSFSDVIYVIDSGLRAISSYLYEFSFSFVVESLTDSDRWVWTLYPDYLKLSSRYYDSTIEFDIRPNKYEDLKRDLLKYALIRGSFTVEIENEYID